jgi:ABC-type sugar transport system ATPase subunit
MSAAVFSFQNVHFAYPGGRKVLWDFTLDVHAGETLCIVGTHESGKSTVLSLASGMLLPTEGVVKFNGEVLAEKRPAKLDALRRQIGFVSSRGLVLNNTDVFSNIALPLRYEGKASEEDIDEQVRRVASDLHITDILEAMPSSLSIGQVRRVDLARAIVIHPSFFLMDDPLQGQLGDNLERMLHTLKQLRDDRGRTVLMSSIPHESIPDVADRVAWISRGRLMDAGEAGAVMERVRQSETRMTSAEGHTIRIARTDSARHPGELPSGVSPAASRHAGDSSR